MWTLGLGMLVMVLYLLCDRIAHLSYWSSGRPYMYIRMYVHTYTNYNTGYWSPICDAIAPICTYALQTTAITLPSNSSVRCLSFEPVMWYSHLNHCCHNTQLTYTRNPWQPHNMICIHMPLDGISYTWEHVCKWYVRTHIRTYVRMYVRMCVIV